MLRFFRNIRQRLLTENRVNRYLLYAIGEIVLVVIGILIALQINNWNETQKERVEEKKLLRSLLNEFQRNQFELNPIEENFEKMLDAVANTLRRIQSGKLNGSDPTVLSDLAMAAYGLEIYRPINNATNSIIASGKLELIRNEELKKFLNQWEFYCRRYMENALLHPKLATDQLLSLSQGRIPMRNAGYTSPVRPQDTIGPSSLNYPTEELANDPVFEQWLESKRIAITELYGNFIWVEKIQNDILNILRDELDDKGAALDLPYSMNDLRITGFAINEDYNVMVGDFPLHQSPVNKGVWEVELNLKDGWLILKNRESWYDWWALTTFPDGRLLPGHLVQQEAGLPDTKIPTGHYHLLVDMNSLSYSFRLLHD